jgi:hypothetical protein
MELPRWIGLRTKLCKNGMFFAAAAIAEPRLQKPTVTSPRLRQKELCLSETHKELPEFFSMHPDW